MQPVFAEAGERADWYLTPTTERRDHCSFRHQSGVGRGVVDGGERVACAPVIGSSLDSDDALTRRWHADVLVDGG